MKKIVLSFATLVLLATLAFTTGDPVAPLAIGSNMPLAELKMKDVSGKDISIKNVVKANGVLVMFSCNTCPIVKKYESRIIDISKFALENNFGVIILNPNEAYRDNGDSYTDMIEYAKTQGFNWNYVLDNKSEMADVFGATRTPEVFLFDNVNNKSSLVYHGAIDDNQNGADGVTRMHLHIAMKELMDGKEISTKNTRSVGCTIKRLK